MSRNSRVYVPQEMSRVMAAARTKITPFWTDDGGLAVPVYAGEDLSRGHIVTSLQLATALDGHVYKVPTSGNNLETPQGVVYADAYKYQLVWIVVIGIAYVLPVSSVTAGRGYVIYCGTSEAGRGEQSASLPSVTNHAREAGHWLDTGTGNGVLTRAILHWN